MKELQFYPLALLGNFQRYGVLRLGKFPNKLRYFLRKYPAACRRSFGGSSPCRLLTRITSPYYFPLSVGKQPLSDDGLIPRPTDRYAIHRRLGSVSATTDTITVVFSFRRCVILSNNTLRTFVAPNDSIRKARTAIVSRS